MIEIKNISLRFQLSSSVLSDRYITVFDNFSLSLTENKIYGLLGKNGMGKSSLLYLINGLNETDKGEIYIDGDKVSNHNPSTIGKVFLVPEEIYLPDYTLKKYLKINAPFYPEFSMEVFNNCMRDFELEETDRLDALSMGQKKKVYMSFALATNAKYLLLDEPTNGLDIPSKKQFRKVVAQNMTEDRTLIISTHQVHDLEQLLDHVIILGEQQLLMDKPVADIMNEYVFEYRPSNQMDGVIYSEPSFQGNAVIAPRTGDTAETQVNLELLFNAVNSGKL